MSFVDALPAFRTKQWQVVALLFIDALSVCRLPALISYMTDRRASFHRVRTFVYIILIYYFIYMMDRRKVKHFGFLLFVSLFHLDLVV